VKSKIVRLKRAHHNPPRVIRQENLHKTLALYCLILVNCVPLLGGVKTSTPEEAAAPDEYPTTPATEVATPIGDVAPLDRDVTPQREGEAMRAIDVTSRGGATAAPVSIADGAEYAALVGLIDFLIGPNQSVAVGCYISRLKRGGAWPWANGGDEIEYILIGEVLTLGHHALAKIAKFPNEEIVGYGFLDNRTLRQTFFSRSTV
jgi:hypothetical protein